MADKNSNLGFKITIILLSVVIVYLLYDKITNKSVTVELIDNIEITTFERDSLRDELADLYFVYNNLRTDNDAINDSLDFHKERVEELMKEIRQMKSYDNVRIQQLKTEVETLKDIMKSFVRQIDSLYQENQILVAENINIKQEYNIVVGMKDDLQQEKESLQETVSIAKELVAYNTNFVGLNRRERSTDRINRTEIFEICFMLSENRITSTGNKTVYIRITKPDGEVLRNQNSGFFNYKNEAIAYSSLRQINYDGSAQNVCLYFDVEVDNLPPGDYTVYIFVDNTQIGDKRISLR